MTAYLVRFEQLRLPMRLDAGGILRHAVPKVAYSVFASLESARAAIVATVAEAPERSAEDLYEIVPCEEHEAAIMATERRSRKVKAAKARAKKADAEDEEAA